MTDTKLLKERLRFGGELALDEALEGHANREDAHTRYKLYSQAADLIESLERERDAAWGREGELMGQADKDCRRREEAEAVIEALTSDGALQAAGDELLPWKASTLSYPRTKRAIRAALKHAQEQVENG